MSPGLLGSLLGLIYFLLAVGFLYVTVLFAQYLIQSGDEKRERKERERDEREVDDKRRALYHRLAYEIPCACLLGIFVPAVIPRGFENARPEASYSWRTVLAVMILFVLVSGFVLIKLARAKGIDLVAWFAVLFGFFTILLVLFPDFP